MKSLDEMKQMAHRNAGVVLISPRDLTLLCFIVGVCSVVVGSVLIIVAVGGAAGLFADAPAVNVHVHLEDPQKFDMVRAKERLSSSILTGIAKDPFCTLYSKKRSNLGAGRVWDARGDVNRESPRTAIHARGESVRVSDRTYHCTTEEQIAALCAIKALNNPANWPEVDPCQFTASPCEEFLDGVACCTDPTTNNSYVTALDLHATQLRGSIPEEIASLCALEYLDFSDNTLEDEMPMEVFELIHLTYIDIHENRLEGDIPPFARLSHLTFLDVHDNKLAGQIPDDFYTLPDLSFNDLNSTIPASFASLDSLQYLDMSSATLTGTIPFSLGNDLDLIYLFLTSNRLTGQIPESFGNMPSLQYLRLNNNFLTGAIPQSIPAMSSLLSLDLSRNWMDGTIPEFRNTEKIFYIDLSSNGFSGEIPRSIANLSSLYLLDLSDNILDGQVSSPLSDYLQILPQWFFFLTLHL
ncbi:Kinase family protein with leucine-rich repeat domain [Pelomyxa schiedti]|nr:Kinase family protein with leucine-rich repeat domain [Pelomyxa schiedti]